MVRINSCETLVDDDVIIDEIGLELLLNCLRYIVHMMDVLLMYANFVVKKKVLQ